MSTDIHWEDLTDFAKGNILAIGAAILFGIHVSFSAVKADISMTIYKIYFLIGTSITCFIEVLILFALGYTIHFTYLGIVAAVLLLCFEMFLVLSIQKIGIGYATGFAVFSACVAAPIAQYILGQAVAEWYIMVTGLFVLAFSVFIIAILKDILRSIGILPRKSNFPDKSNKNVNKTFPLLTVIVSDKELLMTALKEDDMPLYTPHEFRKKRKRACSLNTVIGLMFSMLSGICMDLLPLPSLYTTENSKGLKFFLSFGIGCILVIPLCALMIFLDDRVKYKSKRRSLRRLVRCQDKLWHYKNVKVIIPAIASGIIWSAGNICSFLSFLYLNYTTAVAYVQCQIIVVLLCLVLIKEKCAHQIEVIALILLCLLYLGGCIVVVYGVHGTLDLF